jgi:hypothetical protein
MKITSSNKSWQKNYQKKYIYVILLKKYINKIYFMINDLLLLSIL